MLKGLLSVVLLALAVLIVGCEKGKSSGGAASGSEPLRQALIEATRAGSPIVTVPRSADTEWYVVAPPYAVTDQWADQNLALGSSNRRSLVDASNAREDVLVASGKGQHLLQMGWLPSEYTAASQCMLLRPGDTLSIRESEGPRRFVIERANDQQRG